METTRPRPANLLAVGGLAAVTAVAVNAAIVGLARAADVSFAYTESADSPTKFIGWGEVLGLSLVSFAVGLVAALVAARWGRPCLRVLQILGGVVALGTIYSDVALDASTSSRVVLASMHIVVGVAYVACLHAVRSSAPRPAHAHPVLQRRSEPVAV